MGKNYWELTRDDDESKVQIPNEKCGRHSKCGIDRSRLEAARRESLAWTLVLTLTFASSRSLHLGALF